MKPRDIEQGPWEDALREAREAMIATVRSAKGMIAYGDLITKTTALRMAPNSHALRELLGDISREENKAGRGMLSAVVVNGPCRTQNLYNGCPRHHRPCQQALRKFSTACM